jgi:hypothetical protein
MKRLWIIGVLGLLAAVFLLAVGTQAWPRLERRLGIAAAPPAVSTGAPVHPSRQAAVAGHWAVRLETYGPYADLASAPVLSSPQGRLVLVKLRLQNLGDAPLSINPGDVFIETVNKGVFIPSAQTSAVDAAFENGAPLAPQAVTEHSLVFDVDPASTDPILHVFDIELPLPNLLTSG